jgi:hypothetical protein
MEVYTQNAESVIVKQLEDVSLAPGRVRGERRS